MGIETAAMIAAAAAVASTAVSAYGAIQQAEAQAEAANNQAKANDYQAQVQERNAQVAKANAESTQQQAATREEAMRRKAALFEGQKMAGIAQSGTGFDGSNLASVEQDHVNRELDALNIRYEGDMQAKGLGLQAANALDQANLDRMNAAQNRSNASSIMTGGYLSAGAQLLSAPSKYYTTKASIKG